MAHFINYNAHTGLSINTYRAPEGYANSDVTGLVEDIHAERSGCCPLEGALEALEDGSLWQDADQEILEELHALISSHE